MESNKIRACVIIPARFKSSRFPGKPLVSLLGKPMIIWVAELAAVAVGQANVYVATDDEKISDIVKKSGFSSLMTSSDALTGTDRVAEAAEMIDYDIYINVQGDEPLINPKDIQRCIELKTNNMELIINGYTQIEPNTDASNINIPKVITTESNMLIYISRAVIPACKESTDTQVQYMKQVCIYGFTRDDLVAFTKFGRKSSIEKFEDIEILRFLELDKKVLMYECDSGSYAIDIPDDVNKVEEELRKQRFIHES